MWYIGGPHLAALHIDGLVQDCSNSIATALELQYCSLAPSHRYVDILRGLGHYEQEQDWQQGQTSFYL